MTDSDECECGFRCLVLVGRGYGSFVWARKWTWKGAVLMSPVVEIVSAGCCVDAGCEQDQRFCGRWYDDGVHPGEGDDQAGASERDVGRQPGGHQEGNRQDRGGPDRGAEGEGSPRGGPRDHQR